jgi:CheY-like chemotaxis protein/predicted transcriptional regulator
MNIMVVDDDRAALEEMSEALTEIGYHCSVAETGEDALVEFDRHPAIDVVISDIRMPRMDGLTLIDRLRARTAPGRQIGCILVTGNPGYEEALRALRLKAVDFLTKPLRVNALIEAVRRAEAELKGTVRDEQPAAPAPAGASDERCAMFLRMLRVRAARRHFFESMLFSDPCWDMLLDLMAARVTGKQVSVTSVCLAADIPPTTGLRRIEDLVKAGFVRRTPDPIDGRRTFVELTEQGVSQLNDYFAWIAAKYPDIPSPGAL